jgi:hypothetical protein
MAASLNFIKGLPSVSNFTVIDGGREEGKPRTERKDPPKPRKQVAPVSPAVVSLLEQMLTAAKLGYVQGVAVVFMEHDKSIGDCWALPEDNTMDYAIYVGCDVMKAGILENLHNTANRHDRENADFTGGEPPKE